jgi:hypothetical protein
LDPLIKSDNQSPTKDTGDDASPLEGA